MAYRTLASIALFAGLGTVALPGAQAAPGDVSISLKAGQTLESVSDDFDDIPGLSVDGLTALGVSAGYAFSDNLSAELELVRGGVEISGNVGSVDIDIESISIFAAYRSLGDLYFIGRIGYAREEVSSDDIDVDSETESGLSYGVGGGYRFMPNLAIEADYTRVEEDISWLMLSARYTF